MWRFGGAGPIPSGTSKAGSTSRILRANQQTHVIHRNVLPEERSIPMQVSVRDNNVDQALRALKKKLQREGVFREMRLKEQFEKPSEKRAREKAEAIRRARKLARKKLERES